MRTLRDPQESPNPATSRLRTAEALMLEQARLSANGGNTRAIGSKLREPLMAGDPASPGGTKVTLAELADDVLAAIADAAAGFDEDTILTTLTGDVLVNSAGNVLVRL